MDFFFLIASLALYYIRPQEWMLALQPLKPVTIVGALAVLSVILRKEGFNRKEIFQTPLDYAVPIYVLWIVFVTPDRGYAWQTTYPLYLYYLMSTLALTNIKRINTFLMMWGLLIFIVAGMAVLSEYGFDPTHAYDITHGEMKGRLVLGTSIFNNPNALGHSVVPVVFMLYYLLFWRRPIFTRLLAIPLIGVPLYCIYLTVSKGAFLSGFATGVASLTFGRPKLVQIGILALALTSGWTALQMLPRMEEIQEGKKEGGIQGRVHAFTWGYEKFKSSWTGIGRENFLGRILKETRWCKASHSSFVEAGAELGKIGFFMFVAILYLCLKTLFLARPEDTDFERARRVLFALVIGYIISSWMADLLYRPVFFLFAGTISAFQRLLMKETAVAPAFEENQTVAEALQPAAAPALAIAGLGPAPVVATPRMDAALVSRTAIELPSQPEDSSEITSSTGRIAWRKFGVDWSRFGLIDWVLCLLLTWGAVKFWLFAIERMS